MENRMLSFAVTGVHASVLTLDNYPPVFSVVSTLHTIEDDVIAFETQLNACVVRAEQNAMYTEIASDVESLDAVALKQKTAAKALAVTTLQSLPHMVHLVPTKIVDQWEVSVDTPGPVTAYAYMYRAGNIHEVPLVDVSSIGCERSGNRVKFTITDRDFIAITIETLSQFFLAVSPSE